MTLLIVIISTFFFRILSFLEKKFLVYPENIVNIWKLNQMFESMFTYIYKDGDKYQIYFLGNSKSCSFISYFEPFSMISVPVAVSVSLRNSCLTIDEFPVYSRNTDYLTLENFESEHKEIKIFCGLKDISFTYFVVNSNSRKFVPYKTLHNQLPKYVKLSLYWNSGKTQDLIFKVQAFDRGKEALTKLLSSNIPM